jgi:hypothetical protein
MVLPFYSGLTLSGILATASHGTGDRVASALVDMVAEVTWVDAKGVVHKTSRDDPVTWRAINGGLGLIGAITELKLQLTPPTYTQLKTVLNQPDDNMYETIQELLTVRGGRRRGFGAWRRGLGAVGGCTGAPGARPLRAAACAPAWPLARAPRLRGPLTPPSRPPSPLPQRTPHILIFWRPDMKRYSAFLTDLAPDSLKAQSRDDVQMTLLPDLSQNARMAAGFKMWQTDIRDTNPLRQMMCYFPQPVSIVQSLTVRRSWARAGGRHGEDIFDVVAPTNQMQVRGRGV